MAGRFYGIVLCGGSGSRMGLQTNKVLLELHGKSVLLRSLEALSPFVDGLILVIRKEDETAVRESLSGTPFSGIQTVCGGNTRQASVAAGLAALPENAAYVLIHDGARCLVDSLTIQHVKDAVTETGSGIASVPVKDTIKRTEKDGQILETLDRTSLRAMQTPQGFRRELIVKAHEYAREHQIDGTDDASLLEAMGLPVTWTEGSYRNIKITTPEDLLMAEMILHERPERLRVGTGYDVHRLVEGRRLVLCGVEVPHTVGLLGHSDADVAAHALIDAMLGAVALGDIGQLFPDTDEAYRDIDSMILLKRANEVLREHGAHVQNLDLTICALKPKLAPFIQKMRERLSEVLSLPLQDVSVKATTTEHLGFEGRMEGISANCVVMVSQKG
ncbi:MAG: 2-C-methyl-D-erythritol 4-phosphate cytidylyltransferase [Clostridia bacterium]|nr:2-C-methyl-D-erythritol 4-phosphate cytidylyltransferase [Clostridia bacterium]